MKGPRGRSHTPWKVKRWRRALRGNRTVDGAWGHTTPRAPQAMSDDAITRAAGCARSRRRAPAGTGAPSSRAWPARCAPSELDTKFHARCRSPSSGAPPETRDARRGLGPEDHRRPLLEHQHPARRDRLALPVAPREPSSTYAARSSCSSRSASAPPAGIAASTRNIGDGVSTGRTSRQQAVPARTRSRAPSRACSSRPAPGWWWNDGAVFLERLRQRDPDLEPVRGAIPSRGRPPAVRSEVHNPAPRRHPVDVARPDRLVRSEAVAVHDLPLEQVRHRREADVQVRRTSIPWPGAGMIAPHLVEEHEEATTARHAGRRAACDPDRGSRRDRAPGASMTFRDHWTRATRRSRPARARGGRSW